MTLMFIGVQGGLPIIQQRQAHIIKRLSSTPLPRSTLVLGDLVFRLIVSLLSAALIIVMGRIVFNVQMVGNWFSLTGLALLGSLVFVNLGYLIAAFVKTQDSSYTCNPNREFADGRSLFPVLFSVSAACQPSSSR